ncbi:transglutaminase-like domain-containing protein, partial [Parabacteroides sp. OttesenSCG-928-N08]|nr:transglutaminase-like domain-containing protein [Parabacteroides sp. OttesenSCG-928-N08]
MNKYSFAILLCVCCLLLSCTGNNGIPAKYQPLINAQLEKAGDNRAELERALNETPRKQKEGIAFLIAYMPESDLTTLKADYLLKNVELAYTAREEFPWAKNIPDSLFLNDVLPYANASETRDDWREDFYNRFSPYVKGCTTLEEAVRAINENAKAELGVEYNTARRRADQSPTESLEIMIASCTGLSIMLTDAFRAVGIPSRLAGTIWHDGRGNHTWSEVWIDGEWFFTEYYFEDLNSAWFLADAGKATPGGGQTSIIAASYKPSERNYRQAWNRRAGETAGYDVSQRYIDLYQTVMADKVAQGNHIPLRVKMYKNRKSTSKSDDRVKVMVDIFQGADQLGGGSTAGETQDMNDVLEFLVEKNKEYTLKYFPDG